MSNLELYVTWKNSLIRIVRKDMVNYKSTKQVDSYVRLVLNKKMSKLELYETWKRLIIIVQNKNISKLEMHETRWRLR
jgi:hypothetical protein